MIILPCFFDIETTLLSPIYHINSLILCVCLCVCDRSFSLISPRKSRRSSCFFLSVTSLGGWLSFKPTLESRLALEVPRRAFRPSFPISHIHRSTIGERASPLSIWVGFGRRSTPFFFLRHLDNDPGSTHSTRKAKNRQFSAQTVRLEPRSSGHYRLLSRPGQTWWEVLCVALRGGGGGGALFDPACVPCMSHGTSHVLS